MYSFSAPLKNCARRVARPMSVTSTPVANGSSVPVCPTFVSRVIRRTRITASCVVLPAGLSAISGLLLILDHTLAVAVLQDEMYLLSFLIWNSVFEVEHASQPEYVVLLNPQS